MKRTLLFLSILLLAAVFSASATQISEGEALDIANKFVQSPRMKGKSSNQRMRLAYTSQRNGEKLYYTFNRGDKDGFVIVSAEGGSNAVLGYSDHGSFDYDSIPENMRWWLSTYEDQISRARKEGLSVQSAPSRTIPTSVEPLLKSHWDQYPPYNDMCPVLSDGSRALAGSPAIAMAQVMYYHRWPERGTGSHSYDDRGTTRSADFASTAYKWDAMTPSYDESSSEEAKSAVATLVYHCGVAAETEYVLGSSDASNAAAVTGMIRNLGYDDDARIMVRDCYGRTEWEQMLRKEIDAKRPILYGGYCNRGSNIFVCDGYDENGMFHMNWGVKDLDNGYFQIQALFFAGQGLGGAADGFNYNQQAVINLHKADETSNPDHYRLYYSTLSTSKNSVGKEDPVTFSITNLINSGYIEFEGIAGIGIFDVATNKMVDVKYNEALKLAPSWYYSVLEVEGKLPADIKDGKYRLNIVTKGTDSNEWIPCGTYFYAPQNYVTVSGHTATFSEETYTSHITASNLSIKGTLRTAPLLVSCSVTNSGKEYFSTLNVVVMDKDTKKVLYKGAEIVMDILTGETQTAYLGEFTYNLSIGDYLLGVVDDTGNLLCPPANISLGGHQLRLKELSVDRKIAYNNNFSTTAIITNEGDQDFEGTLGIKIGGSIKKYFFPQNIKIKVGEVKEVTFAGYLPLDSRSYNIDVCEEILFDTLSIFQPQLAFFTLIAPIDFYTYTLLNEGYKVGLNPDFRKSINENALFETSAKIGFDTNILYNPAPDGTWNDETTKPTPVYSTAGMFKDCTFNWIDIGRFDFRNVTDMTDMFANCGVVDATGQKSIVTTKDWKGVDILSNASTGIDPAKLRLGVFLYQNYQTFALFQDANGENRTATVVPYVFGEFEGYLKIPEEVYFAENENSLKKEYTVTAIAPLAFNNLDFFNEFIIPNTVTKIGDDAFHNCTELTSITIGTGIMSIGAKTFAGAPALSQLSVMATTPPQVDATAFEATQFANVVLTVPNEALEAYRAHPVWGKFLHIVGTSRVDQVEGETLNVARISDGIMVSGAKEGALIELYSTSGMLIRSGAATDGTIQMEGIQRGTYILKAGIRTMKVVI